MKEILLTDRAKAFVDDEDYEWLNRYTWYLTDSKGNRYARTNSFGGVYMHVLIMMVPPPPLIVRHLNDIGLHNWRENLKVADQSENLRHAHRPIGRKSNLPRGVTRHVCGRYQAQMTVKGKVHYLGLHNTPELAAAAYTKKYVQLFGAT